MFWRGRRSAGDGSRSWVRLSGMKMRSSTACGYRRQRPDWAATLASKSRQGDYSSGEGSSWEAS